MEVELSFVMVRSLRVAEKRADRGEVGYLPD